MKWGGLVRDIYNKISIVIFAMVSDAAIWVLIWYSGGTVGVLDSGNENVVITEDKLMTSDNFISFGFGYGQTYLFETPAREINMSYNSPFYDPHNYTLGIILKDETALHAHLDNVRLVKTDGDELVRYYKIDDHQYYIELNISAEAFDLYLTDDFFERCDQYQIVFVKQYLSDGAIDMTEDGD